MKDKIWLKWLRINSLVVMGSLVGKPHYSSFIRKRGPRKGTLGHRLFLRISLAKTGHVRPNVQKVLMWDQKALKASKANLRDGCVLIIHGRLMAKKFLSSYPESYIEADEMQVVRQSIPSNCKLVHKDVWEKMDPLQRELGELAAISLFGEDMGDGDETDLPEHDRGDGEPPDDLVPDGTDVHD